MFVEFESSWDPMSYSNDPYDQVLHAWHLFFFKVSVLRFFVRIDCAFRELLLFHSSALRVASVWWIMRLNDAR